MLYAYSNRCLGSKHRSKGRREGALYRGGGGCGRHPLNLRLVRYLRLSGAFSITQQGRRAAAMRSIVTVTMTTRSNIPLLNVITVFAFFIIKTSARCDCSKHSITWYRFCKQESAGLLIVGTSRSKYKRMSVKT